MGSLTANGQIWLINPNGIAFGKSARVDVAGLLATTIDIADRDLWVAHTIHWPPKPERYGDECRADHHS